ncbi:MAG: hypothetical protein KGP14_15840, partial [Betaproteobacteria bacterium]|nr:hypothetical protein [Betaproteobacteria bacterium]
MEKRVSRITNSLIFLIVLLLPWSALAADTTGSVNIRSMGGTAIPSGLVDTGNSAFKVNCVVGCSAAGSFTDNSAF